jgi:hypothetical protein
MCPSRTLGAGLLRLLLLLARLVRRPAGGTGERKRHAASRRSRRLLLLAADVAAGARLADPWLALRSWWRAWSSRPPPRELQELTDAVAAGQPLDLYLRA